MTETDKGNGKKIPNEYYPKCRKQFNKNNTI